MQEMQSEDEERSLKNSSEADFMQAMWGTRFQSCKDEEKIKR